MAVAHDALKIARRLVDAGLEPKTAEGVSETFVDVLATREDSLVTKSALRQELATLRGEIRTGNFDLLKWIIGSQIALAGILFAAIQLF